LKANAFNFVAPNLVAGVRAIEGQARTSAITSPLGVSRSLRNAKALVGPGSVAVEAVRMCKGKAGTTLVGIQ